jgi:hypothetical protein
MRNLERSQRQRHSGKHPPPFFKLTRIGCRILWPTEANVTHSSLLVMMTYEHAYSTVSSTYLQLIDGGEESGGPDISSLVIFQPPTPEDSVPRIALLGSMHSGVPRLAQRTTKSRSGLLTSSPGWESVPFTLTLTAPRGTSSTSSSTRVCTFCKGEALLPSYADTASTSCADSPSTSVSWCAPTDCEELKVTVVRSLALTADGAATGKYGGLIGHVADQRTIRVVEV